MRDLTWWYIFVISVACASLAQDEARIVSSPETISVYSGQTAFLKCRVINLGTKMVRWTLMTHNVVIYEGGQLFHGDSTKYSLKKTADEQSHSLQISNVEKFDRGFYQCAIDGTDQQIITHLNVLDVPSLLIPPGRTLNYTDCCIAENVTDACRPGCFPSQIDLSQFNPIAACGTISNLKGLSKCFTGGSNHDNCCLTAKVDPICLGFCHNDVATTLTPEYYTKCFTDEVINAIFTCFETSFDLLPSEPTDVTALAFYAEQTATILVAWSEPHKNPHIVTGYMIMYKPLIKTTYTSILIKDPSARTYRLNGDEAAIQGDSGYVIRISALADHGTSFGSVEVEIYFPALSIPSQLKVDVDTCCSNRNVDEKCRVMLCDSRTWSKFDTDNILACFPYLSDVFTCLVGERNHTNCCAAYDVTSDCLPLCSGHPPPLNNSLIGCVNQMGIIEACVQQGYSTQPAPPTKVTIVMVETTSALIQFKPSTGSSLRDYLVEMREGDENAPFEFIMTVGVSEHVVSLNDLSPNTYYWLRIISEGTTSNSLPSETVAFLTYPEGYDSTQPKVTNIPHNLTDCCINSGMPKICWEGCEYRTNITSYYRQVLQSCYLHIGSVLTCAADGRDHSECCRNRAVQPGCVQLCAYTENGSLDLNLVKCIADTEKAIACFQEGIVNLPRHPDVVVFNVSKNSISLKWEQPKTSGLIDSYIINYGTIHTPKTNVSTSKTFYILQDLQPSTQYEVSVTSSNSNGTSAPSPLITLYTLSGDIQAPPSFNKTEVSGRALWQNISHCCENNFHDVCLKQCLNEQTAYTQQTTCISDGHKMLACFADGKDHRLCCEERSLPSDCLPICGGHAITTEISMATCMSYYNRKIILSCFLENKYLIPGTPSNFGAKLIGTNGSVMLQWSPASNCNSNCTYGVHFWKSDPGSVVSSQYNIIDTSIVLTVESAHVYTFTVTAQNTYGSSSPSAWQTLYIISYERNVYVYLDSNTKWVENGQSANLVCQKFGFNPDGLYRVEWKFNNRRQLDNDDKMRLLIPNVDPARDEGEYTCSVKDSEIISSDSLFLTIKYAPKFSHFIKEEAKPGVGQSTKIDCLFQGLPDSDPNKWLKNGQAITQDSRRYTMTQNQDYETGLTTYRITISDVIESDYATYSLSVFNAYGSAECQMNLNNPASIIVTPSSGIPDLKQCCSQNNMSSFCQELCGFHINVTEIVKDLRYIPCLQYFKIYFTCGADGRDHTKCCQKQGVLPMCIPLCKGEVPVEAETAIHLLPCVAEHALIFSCAQQGHMQLPYAPEDVTLTYNREDGTILVRWKAPHSTAEKVDHYIIYYNYSGSPVPKSVSVNAFVMEYYIKNVQPRTIYNVWITAGNENGTSLATSIQKADTSLDPITATSEKHESNEISMGVGIACGVIVLIAIVVVAAVFMYRSNLCPTRGNRSVTFENHIYDNQDQVKIQEEQQYRYGRLQESSPEAQAAAQDSSSSAADSSFENPVYKLQQPGNSSGAATLQLESHS